MFSQFSDNTKKSSDSDGGSNNGQGSGSESQRPSDNGENKTNKAGESQGSCYCGKDRNLNIVELLCAACGGWFHESCIGYQLGRLVPFMTNYLFICKNCSPTGLETFKKNQATFPQMCVTAIANLRQASARAGGAGGGRRLFSKDREIIPYIEQHWEAMTTMPRRVTQSWYATVQRALIKDISVVFTYEEGGEAEGGAGGGGPMFGLHGLEPAQVRPNYDAMIRQGALKVTEMGVAAVPLAGGGKGRVGKRRAGGGAGGGAAAGDGGGGGGGGAGGGGGGAGGKRGRGGGDAGAGAGRHSSHGYPTEHPFNKDGYRYILAEPDPHAPFRQEFDESSEWSGKPIPGWLYRALCPPHVLLAAHDRAPQLRLGDERRAASGERGYCGGRATHGVSRGTWYWEATVEEVGAGGAARLGWARRGANLQAPLGYDRFGYAWRSRKGTRFHESRGKHYSSGYGEGDVLGFLIVLPDSALTPHTPPSYKDRPLVKFKSHLYYEDKDSPPSPPAAGEGAGAGGSALAGSRVYFFRNGECQGEAFRDLHRGTYYPALSLHRAITVSVNFGPTFRHPPRTQHRYRPMCEKAEEAICEQTVADMLYLADNEGKLRLDTFNL